MVRKIFTFYINDVLFKCPIPGPKVNGSHPESRVSVIGILTRYRMDVSAVESRQEKEFFYVVRNLQTSSGVHPAFSSRRVDVLDWANAAGT
jgi:hypothetical protein